MEFFLKDYSSLENMQHNKKKAAKRERRAVRRQLEAAVFENLSLKFRLRSTVAQQRSAARKIADQLFAGKNPALAVPLPGHPLYGVEA